MNNEIFLKLYNEIENEIISRYGLAENYQGALVFFKNKVKEKSLQLKIDQVRKLRNFLVHEDVSNYEMFEITNDVINFLKDLLVLITNPIKAIDICSKRNEIVCASLNSKVMDVMNLMNKNGYSHIPIINDKNVVIGIFSESTLFSYALNNNEVIINKDTTIYDFYKYILFNNHSSDKFIFASDDIEVKEIIKLFKINQKNTKKLKMILLTKDGNPLKPLIGLITPFDLFKI